MRNESHDVSVIGAYQEQIVALRKASLVKNLPITSRMIRLRGQHKLMDLLVNYYVLNSVMEKSPIREMEGFLRYVQKVYNKPDTIAEFIKQQKLLQSLPYLLSVIRYEINSAEQKHTKH